MGFFLSDEEFKATAIVPIKARPAKAKSDIRLGGIGCDNCTLKVTWQRNTTPQMAFSGNLDSGDILILGAGPRAEDDAAGKPFGSATDKLLHKVLPAREKDRLIFGYMTRCASYSEIPTADELHACSIHLTADLARLSIKAIVALGQQPLNYFFPGLQIRDCHGIRMPLRIAGKTVWFYPCIEPAFLEAQQSRYGGPEDSYVWPVFAADIRNFFKELDRWPAPRIAQGLEAGNVLIPQSEAEAREMLAAMEGQKAIDIETNNDDIYAKQKNLRPYVLGSKILCAAIGSPEFAIAFPIDHPEAKTDWGLPLVLEIAHREAWAAHNLAFEYVWLKYFAGKLGLPFDPPRVDCTMAASRIYFNRNALLSLEDVGQAMLGVNIKALSAVQPGNLMAFPLSDVLSYCGLDTIPCAQLLPLLTKGINSRNYERLLDSARATADMALLGLPVDLAAAQQLQEEWQLKSQEAAERARSLYEVRAFERATGQEWRISAPQDVAKALVDYGKIELPRTKGGKQFSTEDEDLTKAAGEDHPLVRAVLDYRNAEKTRSTYLDPFLDAPKRFGAAIIHPTYRTTHTHTLRLSSEDPNAQNYPSRQHKEVRKPVVPGEGMIFLKYDYKAVEARLIGMESKDKALCDSILKKQDIHARWRDEVLLRYPAYLERLAEKTKQTEHAKILKGGRDIIKTDFVFASFFGSTANACAARTGMPLTIAQDLLVDFWKEFAGVKKWIKQKRQEYKDTGRITTLTGHIRHAVLPGNEPINTPIQGAAAQLVLDSMNELAALARKTGDMHLHPRIQIHDDLTFIVPEDSDRLAYYAQTIAEILVKVRYNWQIVPLAVEGSIGKNWADMHEFCNYEGKYNR